MGNREQCRRTTLVINREGQKKIILSVALIPSLALAVSAMIIAVFCRKLVGEAALLEAVLPSLMPLFLSVLGFMVLSGLIVFHQALIFSNRVWGPGYRLMKGFEQVRNGDLDCKIKLRKGDHLTEVADAFNELVVWLEQHPPAGMESALSSVDEDSDEDSDEDLDDEVEPADERETVQV